MKKRGFLAFLEDMMLWGLRLVVWLWLWLLRLAHLRKKDDLYDREFP